VLVRQLFCLILAFSVCLSKFAQADITHVYAGYGGDILYTHDIANYPLFEVSGTPGALPIGSGSFYVYDDGNQLTFPPNFYPPGVVLNPSYKSSGGIDAASTNFKISQEVLSRITIMNVNYLWNAQLDVSHYNYYAFSVTQTQMYNLTFQFEGQFDAAGARTGDPNQPPSYAYSGTDALIELYDTELGPQNNIARYTFSGGETGVFGNHVIVPSEYNTPIVNTWNQSVLLEAGKIYQVNLSSYTYGGGSGFMYADTKMKTTFNVTAVPEPGSLTLAASALSIAGIRVYRKRRQRAV
jgi:hypothetical protein